jgi:hypothetical protein
LRAVPKGAQSSLRLLPRRLPADPCGRPPSLGVRGEMVSSARTGTEPVASCATPTNVGGGPPHAASDGGAAPGTLQRRWGLSADMRCVRLERRHKREPGLDCEGGGVVPAPLVRTVPGSCPGRAQTRTRTRAVWPARAVWLCTVRRQPPRVAQSAVLREEQCERPSTAD